MKAINVVAAIIKKDNKVFIAKRGYGEFKGKWEFPGGKIEPGETGEEAVVREIKEELRSTVKVLKFFGFQLKRLEGKLPFESFGFNFTFGIITTFPPFSIFGEVFMLYSSTSIYSSGVFPSRFLKDFGLVFE